MKVIVGLSGGVDSSIAAHLLLEQGHQVEALFMKNWDEDDGTPYCTAQADLSDAKIIADRLGIPLHTANFAAEYWDNVFETFLHEYRAHRTPNPDVLCNREIKFKAFLDYAKILGAQTIATGHYARIIEQPNGGFHLYQGLDANKDQAYFLHALNEEQLAQSQFPLGELTKPQVRELAKTLGFHNYNRKDSTGICFIGQRRFNDFLARFFPKTPGSIVTIDNRTIGEHIGLSYYTIGQRQGLGIGGLANYPEQPWYVVEKRTEGNTLVVVQGSEHPALYASRLLTASPHWINPADCPLSFDREVFDCKAKIRHRQPDQHCQVRRCDENPEQLIVEFTDPQRAITPGQYIVFFDNQRCLGGAQILQTLRNVKIITS